MQHKNDPVYIYIYTGIMQHKNDPVYIYNFQSNYYFGCFILQFGDYNVLDVVFFGLRTEKNRNGTINCCVTANLLLNNGA